MYTSPARPGDLPAHGLDTLVRASLHYYNDEPEVEQMPGQPGDRGVTLTLPDTLPDELPPLEI